MTVPTLRDPLTARLSDAARAHGLTVVASAAWPDADGDGLPTVAGFVGSTFSPLVAHTAARCLAAAGRTPHTRTGTAVVLLSPLGDIAGAVHLADTVDRGGRVGPLLFFQSVPNAVAGHVAARWGLTGPVVCLSADAAGMGAVALLLADGDADEALVVLAEQGAQPPDDRAAAVLVRTAPGGGHR
jgi:hypothetical protein